MAKRKREMFQNRDSRNPQEKAASTDQLHGYIFLCNGRTKPECFSYRVFGLPASRLEVVEKINPSTKLFLFDFDLKLLYGIYKAASSGTMALEPTAFGGRFNAQVRFDILKDCLLLPESAFKHAIEDNYQGGSKFRQELSDEQVNNLITLFRPISVPPSASVALLSPNVVPQLNSQPPIMEETVQLPAKLSPPDDQDVGGLQLTGDGLALISRHIQQVTPPPGYERHYRPALSVQPGGAQPYSESYYPAEANEPYFPENPVSSLQDTYSRYNFAPKNEAQFSLQSNATDNYYYNGRTQAHTAASLQVPPPQSTATQGYYNYNAPTQAHDAVLSQVPATSHNSVHLPSSYLLAAYWAAVASEASNQVDSASHMRLPSGSTGLEGDDLAVSLGGANASHLPSSSRSAPYWAAVAAEVPNQVYSSHQGLSKGDASFRCEVTNAHRTMFTHQSASFPSSSQPSVYQTSVPDAMYYDHNQMRPS